jgi:hypothetical protein
MVVDADDVCGGRKKTGVVVMGGGMCLDNHLPFT